MPFDMSTLREQAWVPDPLSQTLVAMEVISYVSTLSVLPDCPRWKEWVEPVYQLHLAYLQNRNTYNFRQLLYAAGRLGYMPPPELIPDVSQV